MNFKRERLIAIPIIILLIVFGISIPLIISISNKMESSASKNLFNATDVIENNVSTKVQADLDNLTRLAESGVSLDPGQLQLLHQSSGFKRMAIVGEDGQGYLCDGQALSLTEDQKNSPALTSEAPRISSTYFGPEGRRLIAFSVPLKNGDAPAGTLMAERKVEDYYTDSVFSFYNGAGRGYLVDAASGEFELKTVKSDGLAVSVASLFDILKETDNPESQVGQIKEAMAAGKTGSAKVRYNGDESYICFTPVSANDHWYMVTFIAQKDLMAESITVRRSIIFMLAVVAGGLILVLCMAFIIVLKSRKEEERRKRTALLESITSTVDHAFVVYNPEKQRVEYASENMGRLFGLDSQAIAQDIGMLFEWLGIPADDSRRIKFMAGGIEDYYKRENRVEEEDRTRWIKSEVSPSADRRCVVVLTDITSEQEYAKTLSMAMENAETANRAKSAFLSSMSHDIRTPMNGIIGMTAIAAANADSPEKVRDCLKKISDASAYLLSLINEVLDMSKIESGKASLDEAAFNLSDFMDRLIQMNHQAIENKGQRLAVYVSGLEHERILTDELKLQQVFMNLVSNAVKYTPEGGKIELSLTEKPASIKGFGCYEFVCRDNGIGMSDDFAQKIFEPFVRDQNPDTRGIQGTGLGMAIVKNIIDMMGGIIRVETAPGEGTAVTVILNFRIEDAEELEQLPSLPVLVVDDDPLCCQSTADMLADIGMDAEWVLTGGEAVDKCVQAYAREDDYFAVILDWKMPGMDGIETARRIRAAVGPDLPIIILTAYNYEAVEAVAREAGVTTFLPKPLFKTRLYRKLKHLLKPGSAEEPDIRKAADSFDLQGARILLVEDNALNMEIAESILAFTKAEIDTAYDGQEAVDKFMDMPEGHYDLVLMDIQMPVMDGYAATRAIRGSSRSDAQSLPIIAMTANAFTEDREKGREAGMNGHITKPVDIQKLMDTLEENLEKR